MTIDEAIELQMKIASKGSDCWKNCRNTKKHCKDCMAEHEQIAEWLEELKSYRAHIFSGDMTQKMLKEKYNNGWIPCSERLPEEKLCEDGKYDPSEKVLIQLDNEEMFTSRYWSHRHSKDSDDFEKWIDLPDYYQDRVLAWQPLPEPYEEHW